MTVRVLSLILLVAVATGCATTITKDARNAAAKLDGRMAIYQEAQEKRVSALNEQYRRLHTRLMRELATIGSMDVDHEFQLDALRNAEQLAAHWKDLTSAGQLRDLFAKNVEVERKRLDDLDSKLAAARAVWADAYQKTELDLSRLRDARSHIQALADYGKARMSLKDLLGAVMEIYQGLNEQKDSGGGK